MTQKKKTKSKPRAKSTRSTDSRASPVTQQPTLELVKYSLDSLKLDPDNVRQHGTESIDSIKASLERFGQQKPIVVQGGTDLVLAGNGTVMAARLLKWDALWGVKCNLTGPTAAAYAFADNRTGELSKWNFERVAEAAFQLIQRSGKTIEAAIGFTERQAAQILQAMTQRNTVEDLSRLSYNPDEDFYFIRAYEVPLTLAERAKLAMTEALREIGCAGIVRIKAPPRDEDEDRDRQDLQNNADRQQVDSAAIQERQNANLSPSCNPETDQGFPPEPAEVAQ